MPALFISKATGPASNAASASAAISASLVTSVATALTVCAGSCGRCHLGGRGVQILAGEVGQDHAETGLGEAQRRGPANAACRTCYDGDPAGFDSVLITHGVVSPVSDVVISCP